MATPGALARFHPFCAANPVDLWPGAGARDTIHYLSGLVLHRRFTVWEEGRAYELEIGRVGKPGSRVRWEVAAKSDAGSALTISIWPRAFVGFPWAVRWALHRGYVMPLLRRYLNAVLRGLDYHLTTGREVTPNQFGRLWYFSWGAQRP